MLPRPHFEAASGTLDARVFASSAVFGDEQTRHFRRSWLLIGPTRWLADQGAFLTTWMGRAPVIAWRDASGGLSVFENRCVGGLRPLTGDVRGQAQTLTCPCHGWLYGPETSDVTLQPVRAPRTQILSGFLFACWDADAPALETWMGDFKWCWDLIDRQFTGGPDVCGGQSLRTRIACNWKLAAEAYSGDAYSDLTVSRATREVLDLGAALVERPGLQICADAGAVVALTDEAVTSTEDPRDGLIPVLATLFPNVSYDGRGRALHVWHPLGVAETVVETYCLVGRKDPPGRRDAQRRRCQHLFGPAGLLTQDQGAVWSSITAGARSAVRRDLNIAMGLGRERRSNLPGWQADIASEMNQRAFYGWWQAQLDRPAASHAESPIQFRPSTRAEPARSGSPHAV